MGIWGMGSDDVGLIQSTKAPKPAGLAVDVIREEAWPFYRTSSGVRLCWELEEPKGPNGPSGT